MMMTIKIMIMKRTKTILKIHKKEVIMVKITVVMDKISSNKNSNIKKIMNKMRIKRTI